MLATFSADKERDFVRASAEAGVPSSIIAQAVGLDVTTLNKRYGEEIEQQRARGLVRVQSAIYREAMEGSVSAAIEFMTKIYEIKGKSE